VFDTRGLHELLTQEDALFDHTKLNWCSVVYDENSEKFSNDFQELIGFIEEIAWLWETEQKFPDSWGDFIETFLLGTCRFKHQAFKEEREVRIVANPMSDTLKQKIIQEQGRYDRRQDLKAIHYRSNNTQTPYIKLFDFPTPKKLPVRRIIVGPHHEQAVLKAKVEALTDGTIEVVCSETPLRWA
jgi:hypothetical protein